MTTQTQAFPPPTAEEEAEKPKCVICGLTAHSLISHLQQAHAMTPKEYGEKHPGAQVLSPYAMRLMNATRPGSAELAKKSVKKIDVQSEPAFGIKFGKPGKEASKALPGYEGFDTGDGVPTVDKHYHFDMEPTKDALMAIAADERCYAFGPTGSGKTTLFEQIAARLGRPFERIQFHREMEPVELTGTWTVNEHGAMEYMYSGLAKALQLPSIVCFDEYDSGNPVVTAIANALLENKPLVLSNYGGRKIFRHPDCRIVATGNTNGMGDDTGLYASVSVQSFATMNRFGMAIRLDYMPEENEKKILQSIWPSMPPGIVSDIVKAANMVRAGFKEGKLTCPLSTRQTIMWAKWLNMTGDAKRAFELAFVNQLGPMDEKPVREIFQRVFATK